MSNTNFDNIEIPKLNGKKTALIVGVVILLIILLTSWQKTPGGHEGFQFVQYGPGKGIDQVTVYGEGRHFIFPWNDFITMSVQEKSKTFDQQVLDKNGLTVKIDCAVNYQLRKGAGGWMYSEKGQDRVWDDKIVDPTAKGAIKDVAGKYDAEELYSTKRDEMEVEIKDLIEARLNDYRVDVTFIEIADVDLPDIIKKAIEDKQEQDQKNQLAQKKELEQTYLANAKIQTARGDSASAVIEAAGRAEAYRLESRDLTSAILRKLEIDAWKAGGSQMPEYLSTDGSSLPFIIQGKK
ncbi:MAG: prohibitin family protein [Flavobacteriales bacterium]